MKLYWVFCGLLSAYSLRVEAEEVILGGSLIGELRHPHISSAYAESSTERFKLKISLAESLIGHSVDFSETVILEVGLIKPNRDLIFTNDLE